MPSQFHPGQFNVGSVASRAAARSLIEERRAESKLVEMILVVEESAAPVFHEWVSLAPGSYTRRSRIPEGMTFEDALNTAGLPPVQPKGEYVRLWIDDRIRTVASDRDVQPEF